MIGFAPRRTESIGGGENGGKTVTYVNAATMLENIGRWDGSAMEIRHKIAQPAQNYVVLLQQGGGALVAASPILSP